MTTMADELQELREVGVPALVARYREQFGKEPRSKHRVWLIKRLAWRIQERRLGGLSEVARRRLEELISEIDWPGEPSSRTVGGHLSPSRKPGDPPIGTALVREWRGQQVRVSVVADGYEHDGVVHASLSAAAKAITGTHWNGRLFFGLCGRRKKA